MKFILPLISFLALILIILPAILYLAGAMEKDQMKHFMLVGTVAWFATVPLWMGKKKEG